MRAVLGRGVDVVLGRDRLGDQLVDPGRREAAAAAGHRGGRVDEHRRRPGADQTDPGPGHGTVRVGGHHGAGAAHRVVAVAAGELGERRAAAGGRHAERGPDGELVGTHRGLHRSEEELTGRDLPLAGRGAQPHPTVQEQEHRGHLPGGVGVDQAAHGGAAVADGGVGDVAQRLAQQRDRVVRRLVLLDVGVPGQRPDVHLAAGHPDVRQPGQVVDVDDVLG